MSESKRRERTLAAAKQRLLTPTTFEDARREVDVAITVLIIAATRTGRTLDMIECLHEHLVHAVGAITPGPAGERLAEDIGTGFAKAVGTLKANAAAGPPPPDDAPPPGGRH